MQPSYPRQANDGLSLSAACDRFPECRKALEAPTAPSKTPLGDATPTLLMGMATATFAYLCAKVTMSVTDAPAEMVLALNILMGGFVVSLAALLVVLPMTAADKATLQQYDRRMQVYRRLRYFPDQEALFDPLTCRQEPASRTNLMNLLDAG